MQTPIFYIFIVVWLSFGKLSLGKEPRYDQADFLLHEAGGIPAGPKRDYVAPDSSKTVWNSQDASRNRDYASQFPALGTTSKPSSTAVTGTTAKQQSSAKRDYVAPQLPTSPRTTGKPILGVNTGTSSKPQLPSGKRDYVAPQHSTGKPQQINGNVKDLVDFYDSKNKDQKPQKPSSYSSILQGSSDQNQQGVTAIRPSNPGPNKHTTKPISYSSIVTGSNKASSTQTISTKDPNIAPSKQPFRGVGTTPLPVSSGSVLPSSIVNRNKNNNQGNANGPSDSELQTLSEELLRKDTNNAFKYINVNYQEKTTSQSKEDKARLPLLTITNEAWNIPTVQKFLPLLDNYERDTLVNEHVTPQERNEENAFMDAIMSTTVIRHLMSFLRDKGYVTPDPKQQRDFLKQLWFSLYSRGKGKISSSGFEHVFVSELKNGDVIGLHNWIYFSKEESANRANYLGYMKYLTLNDRGVIMKLHFNQQGKDKPVNSMFVGTSPELEIALYTLCFVTRADNDCKLKLGNKDVDIVTHTFRYRSKNLIGSAYPQI